MKFTTGTTKLTPQDQDALMKWPQIHGLPLLPADSINKKINTNEWSTFDFSHTDFKKEMLEGKFDNGAAVRLGPTLKGDLYAVALDFDGWHAVVAWFGNWERVLMLSQRTLVEWHQDKGKIHALLLTKEPLPTKKIHIGPKKVLLEIRCERQLLFVSPSPHKDGNKYNPLGVDRIEILDDIGLMKLKGQISLLSDRYVSDKDKAKYDSWLDDPDTILGEGAGRHDATKFKVCRFYWKHTGEWLNHSDDERFERAWQWHLAHCKPPRSRQEFDLICDWVKKNQRAERDRLHDRIREERNSEKEAEVARQEQRQHNANKQVILESIPNKTIRPILESDIWTMISECPLKLIIARQKACYICRASVTYSDSGENQTTKKAHLNYGAILIRLFPKRVIMHENPLRFLEASPQYTIIFEDQSRQEIYVSGTIDGIITKLKEMPGYVVSSYGIAEALTAIIGAFSDDMKLEIDSSVEFEGHYLHNGDVKISRINLDEKHPRRTKEEVIKCIEYLDRRSQFQMWDYKGQTIDKRDLLATAIKWTVPGPFNFAMKQLKCPKPYLKGFDMSGEREARVVWLKKC